MVQRATDGPRRVAGPSPPGVVQRRLRSYYGRHLQNFFGALGRLWQQPFASLMTVAVIGIALALPAGLHVLVINGKALGGSWESVADLSVYLRAGLEPEEALQVAAEIESRPEVDAVELISAAAALEEFRRLSGFGPALDALTDNPLPAVLVVRPAAGHDSAGAVEALGGALDALPETDLVQRDTQWVSRFQAMLDVVRRAVTLAGALLAAAVVIIVGNTIRLDIQNRRAEIEVTKLIGATDAFIRRPFLYSGLWYGLMGGLAAVLLVQLTLWLLAEPAQRVAGLYGSDFRLRSLPLVGTVAVVGGGAFLGWLGSWVAATRHMRAIEPGGNP